MGNSRRQRRVAFVRNGFGYIARDLGFQESFPFMKARRKAKRHHRSLGERIRMLLEELGPTFVKLGQIASTRPDLIPADIITGLERLQDNVPPFSYEEAVNIIEAELGGTIDELFANSAVSRSLRLRSAKCTGPSFIRETS
jgi:ubiquinone biosynthesis protein